jgi:3-amino-4-hydroxybenzoic acid synthase
MKCEKTLWFEINSETPVDIIDKVCQSEYDVLLVSSKSMSLLENLKLPQRIKIAFIVSSIEDLGIVKGNEKLWKKVEYIIADSMSLWEDIKSKNEQKVGLLIDVNDKPTLDKAVELVKKHLDIVIIEFKDSTNIPLELILAKLLKNQANFV